MFYPQMVSNKSLSFGRMTLCSENNRRISDENTHYDVHYMGFPSNVGKYDAQNLSLKQNLAYCMQMTMSKSVRCHEKASFVSMSSMSLWLDFNNLTR